MDETLATRMDAEARTALKRVTDDDQDYAAPPIPWQLPEQLHRMGMLVSTLRWEAVLPTELPEVPEHSREPGTALTDAELARAVLTMPNAIKAVRDLTDRALADCETHGLYPVGVHLRTRRHNTYGQIRRAEETVLTLSVRAVDGHRLAKLADG